MPRRSAEQEASPRRLLPAAPAPELYRYPVGHERSLGWFLGVSLVLFTAAAWLATLLPSRPVLPPLVEVDLGIDAVENEPPPLGEPDAGAGAVAPEPAPEPEPEPEPAAVEPEPPMAEEVPPPEPEPERQFIVPEEKPAPLPKPKAQPKLITKATPKPRPQPTAPRASTPVTGAPAASPAGSGAATGRVGVRGSPGGQPGGRGGGRGDFISTPQPQHDATSRSRRYQGRGVFLIRYSGGRITSVSVAKSTGVPYLDARTVSWVMSRFRVKTGVSGEATLPVTWELN